LLHNKQETVARRSLVCYGSNFIRRGLQICTALKASLVQREVARRSRDGGIVQQEVTFSHRISAKSQHCTATIPQAECAYSTLCQLPEGELPEGQERLAWAITQGSLERSRAREFIDNLKRPSQDGLFSYFLNTNCFSSRIYRAQHRETVQISRAGCSGYK